MLGLALAGLALAFSNSLLDRGLDLLVDNEARLDPMTLQAFQTELTAILTA